MKTCCVINTAFAVSLCSVAGITYTKGLFVLLICYKFLLNKPRGGQNGSVGKGACGQGQRPEFNPRDTIEGEN